ncbi:terminase [Pseudoscardovia suis]|uniref:Terminase n=1 Tax=Pseudoscardovia suis TaxID=987063 RepID=A0A261F0Z8_9BIFI|nr:terminase [Pseudoscardovia suis]OZG52777.1 terminase [Pseudoscardovia suis]PJJ64952.1 hypothetical protein CLV65_1504 [Pseudoscardovia suis]
MERERRLSEVAAVLEWPEAEAVRSDFDRIRIVASRMGIDYDLWQQGLLWILFSRDSGGRYCCGQGGLTVSSCRQIGKTFTLGTAFFVKCMLSPGLKVIWTAHHTRTSDETFADMCSLAQMPAVARHIDHIRRANGQQELVFANGSRIMFGARENGFGRGLHGADVEVFDESQILTDRALSNMIPVMNTASDPLAVFLGNPPKPGDPSDVFAMKRRQALAGNVTGMAYIELAAPRDCDSDDRDAWAKANPSYPARTGEDSIIRMRQLLPEDDFRREALGIWDETGAAGVIGRDTWDATSVPARRDGGTVSFGIDMPPDRSEISIGACMRYPDGTAHVELAECRSTHEHGSMWAVDWLAERWPRTAAVVIDTQSPALSLLPDLRARHVKVTVTGARELGQATGRMLDMLAARTVTHLPDTEQPALADAALAVTLRPVGHGGMTAWQRSGIDVDISPLVAVTLALHGAFTSTRHPGRRQSVG